MKTTATIAGLLFATASAAGAQTLTIYTYDSFVPDWGPGPAIEEAFEAQCDGCDVEFVAAGDGAALLSRLRLEGERTEADIVLGLDSNLVAAARETDLFAPHGVEAEFDLPVEWNDDVFLPFDWSYFAFVAGEETEAPANFRELAESDLSIAIQDPRSSTPGLGLVLWVQEAYGDEAAEIWEGLADNIVTVTPGWSEAYDLFTEGEVDAVLSYTTSPAYHLIGEDDPTKTSWAFDEGNYLQVEVAAVVESTDQPELARDFMEFVTTSGFQSVIPTTNWMYPSVTPEEGLPEGFETLTQPEGGLLLPPQEAADMRDEAIATWRDALSQ
ncbi:thiamine ABC transporter substrate binding subunit [Histidinibacterium aquaticum]|uniref:Thiamine-binding periplasmic protein n=1 Tax=Histidinibacterium aquaticum TaxID=2613962 RepID=A0A5J5GER7_9RHOB|nr:thiamine ABC transporter substrate binding subunit [Histidinibacterium aquaticum]KAA9006665.1 thiamine ABC transporter substrate binding subunit [Histidinibacterium aquaticum]